jgi:fused signal recognition particle receptor
MESGWMAWLAAWFSESPLVALVTVGAIPVLLVAVREWLGTGREPLPPPRELQASTPPDLASEERARGATATAEEAVLAAPPERPTTPAAAPETVSTTAVEHLAAPVVRTADLAPEPVPDRFPAPARLGERLRRTREGFIGRLFGRVGGRRLDAALLGELEDLLFSADLGVKTADGLLAEVKARAGGGSAEQVRAALRDAILTRLRRVEAPPVEPAADGRPHVILVLGVNGSGKTTTIGKLASRHARAGRKVVLGAGDTFRAAAAEQLQIWGERAGCEVVRGADGGDPAAVAFDTVKQARSRGADVALIDTAGRLQTKKPLMEELGKIARVIGRELPGAPHETLLVLDANTGQNAISQAKLFTEVASVTGLVLTKLDGTAKGGVIVGLADEFGIPVRYVGVGESVEDLRDFSAEDFVDALFEG